VTTLALDNKKSWTIPGSDTKISYLRGLLEKFKELSIKLVFVLWMMVIMMRGYVVAQLVEALYYKPEGRGFDSR
jgi:hypothetical protein